MICSLLRYIDNFRILNQIFPTDEAKTSRTISMLTFHFHIIIFS